MIPEDWIEAYRSEDGFTYVIPNYKIKRLTDFSSKYVEAIQLLRELEDDLKVMEYTSIGESSTFHNRIRKVLDA